MSYLCVRLLIKQKFKNMKKGLLAIVALFIALATFGQTDIYRSAFFNGTVYAGAYSDNTNMRSNNTRTKTFEVWVKSDTLTNGYVLHTPRYASSGDVTPSGSIIDMYFDNTDTSFNFKWCNVNTSCDYIHDTNWHHVACTVDTLGTYDTISIYVDGSFVKGNKITHVSLSDTRSSSFTYVGAHNTSTTGVDKLFEGNMSKLVICDSVLYTSTFVPDCVLDTAIAWNDTTIKSPYTFLVPLSFDNNMYYRADLTLTSISENFAIWSGVSYTYGISPCAPEYSFMIPPTGTDSVIIVARQTNKSYQKGAHMSAHNNGWTGSSTSITYGDFNDSMTVYTTASYPYMDDYHHIVTVDTLITITTTGVKDVYNVNDIKVYPNPSTGDFNVAVDNPVALVIYDMTGHIVYSANVTDKTTIHLSQGMYICTTTNVTTNVVRSAKVLIQ